MALKALMLRKKISDLQKALEELRAVDFEAREAELAKAIEEAATDEERAAVEEAVTAYDAEKAENEQKADALQREIEGLEEELKNCESEQEPAARNEDPAKEQRKEAPKMEIRALKEMSLEQREAFFAREEMAAFLGTVRTAIAEKRAITGAGLTIPEVLMPLIRERAAEASKLLRFVNLQRVGGNARAVIMGSIPEGVWTEMCANLNELSLAFNDVEVDGYKVGGFFAICNAVLTDSDYDLAAALVDALGRAIGKALDKAIIYGTGTKMPLGIVTRLAQTSEPAGYPSTARTWVDLHTSNVKTGSGATGLNLFKEIIGYDAAIGNDYYEGPKVWCMNHKTYTKLRQESVGADANALIVAGLSNEMPVLGGQIIELPFIPDNNVVGGFFEAYLLAEREGTTIATSEHVRFTNDQTVLKGTARYDGQPAIPEAFVVFTVTNTAPTTSGISFAADSANPS